MGTGYYVLGTGYDQLLAAEIVHLVFQFVITDYNFNGTGFEFIDNNRVSSYEIF